MADTELWFVAEQNPGASETMIPIVHVADPSFSQRLRRDTGADDNATYCTLFRNGEAAQRVADAFNARTRANDIKRFWPVKVQLDGNAWFASHADFENLHVSDAGFGDTYEDAIRSLKAPSCRAVARA